MKKDILFVLIGVLIMFVFITMMFSLFNQTQEIKLIEKQIQVDSTLIQRQNLLELSDSLQYINQREIQRLLNNHSSQLRRMNERQNQTDLIILDIQNQIENLKNN
jgi:biopolymer transport protein ExbB/TolQ